MLLLKIGSPFFSVNFKLFEKNSLTRYRSLLNLQRVKEFFFEKFKIEREKREPNFE